MKAKSSSLVQLWQTCPVNTPPYVLPADREFFEHRINRYCHIFPNVDSYRRSASFDDPSDSKFHVGLLPIPYIGDLLSARLVLLMLNPGLDAADYVAQTSMPGFRQSLTANLFQSHRNRKYPFIYLDPRFYSHPGSIYWRDKLRKLLHQIGAQQKISYLQTTEWVARRLACLQLVPYHSAHFGMSERMVRSLPSAKSMVSFVHETLMPKARDGSVLLIVLRKSHLWNLPRNQNIVFYNGSQCRSASLTSASPGGKAILRFLKRNPSLLNE